MASSSESGSGGGLALVGIVFVILKLTGTVNWPWVWVLAPFWIGFAIFGVILLVAVIITAIASVVSK